MDKLNEYIEALNRGLALLSVHDGDKCSASIKRGDGFIPLSPFLTYFTRDESGAHRLSPIVEDLFWTNWKHMGTNFRNKPSDVAICSLKLYFRNCVRCHPFQLKMRSAYTGELLKGICCIPGKRP